MDSLVTLVDSPSVGGVGLIPSLQQIYAGDLSFPLPAERPYVIANFVQSLDGVISFNQPGSESGAEISGHSEIDHSVMGMLRARADAVIWGSRSYEAAKKYLATPAAIWPGGAAELAEQRAARGQPPPPLAVIVTGSGAISLDGALMTRDEQPVAIVTTVAGAARLAGNVDRQVAVHAVAPSGEVPADAVVRVLWERHGVRLALHEGGPALFGAFLAAGAIDELFLTLAPQLVGRTHNRPRPGLVEGVAFEPGKTPWARLVSLKRGGELLFTRWQVRAQP